MEAIIFRKIWFDEDLIELEIEVKDESSCFISTVYTDYQRVEGLLEILVNFRDNKNNDIHEIQFGGFGREWANGAFKAKIRFRKPYTLYISTDQEREYDFSNYKFKKAFSYF